MNKYLLLLFTLIALSSCTIYKDFPIDVYKPGEVGLPPNAKKIAIVSRNFKYTNDTLQNYYKSDYRLMKDKKNESLNIDSLAVSKALERLASGLQEGGKFEKIETLPYNTIKAHRGEKLSTFNWDLVNNLATPVNADLLISLETLSYFFSSYNSNDTVDPPSNEVITAAVWGIYDPSTKKLIDRKQMVDTISWNGFDEETQTRKYNLPQRIDAIKLACEIVGENYAKRLTPSWQKVYRMYTIPPIEDFRKAAEYFEGGKWDDAINLWAIYTPEKFRKLAIYARYNIAMGFEIKDEIDKALNWITKAETMAISIKSLEDLKMVELYKKILIQRLADYKKLNQ
jgi:hypothetical protein